MLGKRTRVIVAGAALMLGAQAAAVNAATVAYWQFDENGTDAIDAVGTSQTLTRQAGSQSIVMAADPVPNPDAGPFTTGTPAGNPFSVFNPRFLTETSTPFRMTASSFTLEGWFQTSGATTQFIAGDRMPGSIAGANTVFSGWHVQLAANGTLQFYSSNASSVAASINTVASYNDGVFHHFAAVWNAPANALALYIDGSLAASGSGLGTGGIVYAAGANQFAVGGRHTGSGSTTLNNNLFSGRLDELRFSDAALAPAQFLNHVVVIPEPALAGALVLMALGLVRRR